MRFKVASRVRGLSDEAFREAFGTEEQCRAALLRLRLSLPFIPSCLPTTARLSGTDIILSQWIL